MKLKGVSELRYEGYLQNITSIQENTLILKSIIDCYDFRVNINKFKAKNGLFSTYKVDKLPMPLIGISFIKDDNELEFPFITLRDTGDTLILNGKSYRYFRIIITQSMDHWVSFTYIPELHPRLFATCENKCDTANTKQLEYADESHKFMAYAKTLTSKINNAHELMSLETDDYKFNTLLQRHMSSWLSYTRDYEACLLSHRTIENCTKFGKGIISTIDVVWSVLESFINKGEYKENRSNKEHTEKHIRKKTDKQEKTDNDSVVLVYNGTGEELMTLSNSKWRRSKNRDENEHGTHASPREHIRKEHLRQYKSGKIVYIGQTTINKGKEKTPYEFRTTGVNKA